MEMQFYMKKFSPVSGLNSVYGKYPRGKRDVGFCFAFILFILFFASSFGCVSGVGIFPFWQDDAGAVAFNFIVTTLILIKIVIKHN